MKLRIEPNKDLYVLFSGRWQRIIGDGISNIKSPRGFVFNHVDKSIIKAVFDAIALTPLKFEDGIGKRVEISTKGSQSIYITVDDVIRKANKEILTSQLNVTFSRCLESTYPSTNSIVFNTMVLPINTLFSVGVNTKSITCRHEEGGIMVLNSFDMDAALKRYIKFNTKQRYDLIYFHHDDVYAILDMDDVRARKKIVIQNTKFNTGSIIGTKGANIKRAISEFNKGRPDIEKLTRVEILDNFNLTKGRKDGSI